MKKKKDIDTEPSVMRNDKKPDDVNEQINMFGTYNIQPTSVSDTTYPAISQGLPQQEVERLKEEADRWLKEDKKNKNK